MHPDALQADIVEQHTKPFPFEVIRAGGLDARVTQLGELLQGRGRVPGHFGAD